MWEVYEMIFCLAARSHKRISVPEYLEEFVMLLCSTREQSSAFLHIITGPQDQTHKAVLLVNHGASYLLPVQRGRKKKN